MKKIFIISIALIFLIGVFVFAIPGIPHTFSGTVEYSNYPVMNLQYCDIGASMSGHGLGIIGEVGEDNFYNAAIIPGEYRGEITFYIGGVNASPTAQYIWGGETENFNLIIDELPLESCENGEGSSCGNEVIEPWEDCDEFVPQGVTCEGVMGTGWSGIITECTNNCRYDTSGCVPPQNNGGSSSSSSSGGSSSSSSSGGSSSSSSSGGSSNNNVNLISTPDTDKENKTVDLNSDENQNKKSSGITGAVIGFAKSGIGIGLIFAILIVIAGIIVVGFRNKTKITQ